MRLVNARNGIVQGHIKMILGRLIVEFLSIPYCKTPVNDLRFEKPQAFETFNNTIINKLNFETCPPQILKRIYNGTNEDEESWIPKERQDEDSLYVNIWVPLDILEGKKPEPVFVWIYGGGFVSGSSSLQIYNGSILASQQNIIVVSFNYRVGILGFLSLDDKLMNGNLGIWDQVLALKWIHENIAVFNGNPENITLAGNSAGGCSVSLHLLIEQSWKYYNKVILHSGVSYSDWAFLPREEIRRRSIDGVNKILKKFNQTLRWNSNLTMKDKISIIGFLKRLHFKEFLIDPQLVKGIVQFAWSPSYDGELIKGEPRTLFRQGKFKKCPTIFLNVENEGTYFIIAQFPKIKVNRKRQININYVNKGLEYYPHYPNICTNDLKEKIKKEYNITTNQTTIDIFDRIISEQHFVCDSISLANDVSKINKEVYYLWLRTLSPSGAWPWWCGIMHGEEIYHLYGQALVSTVGEFDKKTSKKLISQYGNFIKNGYLSKDSPRYDEKSKMYISIETDKWIAKPFTQELSNKVIFWENLKAKSKRFQG